MKNLTWIISAIVLLQFTSCDAQKAKGETKTTEINKPHEEVKVNRKYDENGNLIAFDSVYTSYYSSFDGDTVNMDSLMDNFNMYFSDIFDNGYAWNSLIEPDSVFHSSFFSNSFFENQFLQQDEQMLRMMQEMDSLKNVFFEMHARNLSP